MAPFHACFPSFKQHVEEEAKIFGYNVCFVPYKNDAAPDQAHTDDSYIRELRKLKSMTRRRHEELNKILCLAQNQEPPLAGFDAFLQSAMYKSDDDTTKFGMKVGMSIKDKDIDRFYESQWMGAVHVTVGEECIKILKCVELNEDEMETESHGYVLVNPPDCSDIYPLRFQGEFLEEDSITESPSTSTEAETVEADIYDRVNQYWRSSLYLKKGGEIEMEELPSRLGDDVVMWKR